MKRAALYLSFLLATTAAQHVAARVYSVQSIPNVQLSDARRFVTNPDGILSEQAVIRVDTILYNLKVQGRAQVAVIAVQSIGDADPKRFTTELFNAWNLGERRVNNGIIIVLAIEQGAIEIETGYGLEGDLGDIRLKQIIDRLMLPKFRAKDWDGGIIAGVEAIRDILHGVDPLGTGETDETELPAFIAIMGVIFVFLIIIFALASRKKCPRCGKRRVSQKSARLISKSGTKSTYEITYRCSHCGYEYKEKKDIDNNGGDFGSFGGGMIVGSTLGRGMGGFGGGGGWGGGFSGGGGAGGRF